MTRQEYITETKAKLDEISPFDEPIEVDSTGKMTQGFIAASGDSDYQEVKPIVSYIDDCLDKAAWFCLNNLPSSLLAQDVDDDTFTVSIDKFGVGHIKDVDEYMRLLRLSVLGNVWERDVTSFITTADPNYLKQQKEWTRGGVSKPVVAVVPEKQELELFSFPPELCPFDGVSASSVKAKIFSIECGKKAEQVYSNISDFIVLRCAAYVAEILGSADVAQLLMQEYNAKISTILK